MAYQSGSVQNTFELYDALATWVVGGAGWNLQSTTTLNTAGTASTSARDKVFFSSGTDGTNALTYRATFINPENLKAGSGAGYTASVTTQRVTAPEHVLDYIVFKGYLNWPRDATATNAGTSSFGQWGPVLYSLPSRGIVGYENAPQIQLLNYSASNCNWKNWINSWTTKNVMNYEKTNDSTWGMGGVILGWNDVPTVPYKTAGRFDGRRRLYTCYNGYLKPDQTGYVNSYYPADRWYDDTTMIGCYDLANGNYQPMAYTSDNGPELSSNQDYSYAGFCITMDRTTQNEYMYFNAYESSYPWRRCNLSSQNNEFTSMTTMINTNYNYAGFTFYWDGDDHIYSTGKNSTSTFEKYQISTDSWTALTALPTTKLMTYDNNYSSPIYIPHSASQLTMTASDGTPTDVIFQVMKAESYVRRYNVATNEWDNTSGVEFLTLPATFEVRYDKVWWDGLEKIYFWDRSSQALYYTNISGSTYGDWTTQTVQSMNYVSSSFMKQITPIDSATSMIRGQQNTHYLSNTQKMNYWFQGDQDSINVVTETSGNFYWAHFGTYDSLISTAPMKATASFSAGTIVTIGVDSTTNYSTGQYVVFADVSGAATVERNQILEIIDGTSFKVTNLANSYGSGTLIGNDPHKAIATGDTFLAAASLDAGGYQSDSMTAGYRVVPAIPDKLMMLSNTNAQGFYTPWPLMMYNNCPQFNTYEVKGMLKNCWVMKADTASPPSLVSGDSLNVQGTTYKVFPLAETTQRMGNNIDRLLLLLNTE